MAELQIWVKKHWDILENVLTLLVFAFVWFFIAEPRYIPSGSMLPTFLINDRLIVDKVSYRFRDPHRGEIVIFTVPNESSMDALIKRIVGLPGDQVRIEKGELRLKGELVGRENLEFLYLEAHPELFQRYQQVLTSETNLEQKPSVLAHYTSKGVTLGVAFPTQEIVTETLSLKQVAALLKQPVRDLTFKPGGVYINGKLLPEDYINEDPDYTCPGECFVGAGKTFTIPANNYFVMGDNRNNSRDSHIWGTLPRQNMIGKAFVRFWPLNRLGLLP